MTAKIGTFERGVQIKEAHAKIPMVRSNVTVVKDLTCILRSIFVKVRVDGKENCNLDPSLSLSTKEREPGIEAERSVRFKPGGLSPGRVLYISFGRGVPL